MHCHCGTNNRAPRLTFTDPCKPEVRQGAQEKSASPAWCRHECESVYMEDWNWMSTDTRKCHSHTTPGKGIITLETNPSRGTVLTAQILYSKNTYIYIYIVTVIRIGQAMLRSSGSELRSDGLRSPDRQSERTNIRTLSPLGSFGQGPSYSPNRLVSQSAML